MSRLSKFLKQSCVYTPVQRDSFGTLQRNKYGEQLFLSPINLKCRCERVTKGIMKSNGSIITCVSRYYLDTTYPVAVDDLLDNQPILQVSDLVNAQGIPEGLECYV